VVRTRTLKTALAVVLASGLVAGAAGVSAASAPTGGKAPSEATGFDGKTITLGVITPLSGIAAIIGKPLTAGNQLWWDYYNDELGGIGGKYKVELKQEDSAYQPPTAVQAYDKLKGDVAAFQQILGTQITQALLPKVQIDKAVASPATLDGLWVHNPNLVPLGAPYQIEAINALDYFVKNGGKGKKVCALAQDDAYGQAGLDGLAFAKKQLKFKTGPSPRFKTGDDLTAQIQQLADADCGAVLLVATAADATSIATKAISLNFNPQFIALAPFWLAAFAEGDIGAYFQEHLWVTAEQLVAWGDTAVPGMPEFLERQAKYAPEQDPDPYFIFGYAQGQAMAQVLEQAVKDGDLSRDGILKAVAKIKKLTFDGLTGDYKYGNPAGRNPPRTTTLFSVDPASPIGLSILSPQAASAAAKKYKIED